MALRIAQSASVPEEGWCQWSVWIEGAEVELDRVTRVEYVLHPTFPNPVRTVTDRASRFRLDASGWGEFRLYAAVRFRDGTVERLQHDLKLASADHAPAPSKEEAYRSPSLAAPSPAAPAMEGQTAGASPRPVSPVRPRWMKRLAGSLLAITLLAAYLLFVSWPDGSGRIRVLGDAWIVPAGRGVRLLLVALFAGAIGGAFSSVMLLGNFLGNRRYVEASWLPWFLLRPLVGAALATSFYFAAWIALLSSSASASDVSTAGLAAIGLLLGFYSKQATSKVRDVFDSLFRPPPDRLNPGTLAGTASGSVAEGQ